MADIKKAFEQANALTDQIVKLVSEKKPVPETLLDSLEQIYRDVIIPLERYQMITVQDKFWGNVLSCLDIRVNFYVRRAVNLDISTTPFQLQINPLFCKDWVFQEFTGAITDELTKLVLEHPSTYARLNVSGSAGKHDMLEKASSAASTSVVKNDIRLDSSKNIIRIPEGYYTINSLNLETKSRATERESLDYYLKILSLNNGNGGGTGGSVAGSSSGIATMGNTDGVAGHNWESQDESSTRQKTIGIVKTAWDATDSEGRGMLPGNIRERINAMLKPPELNWKDYLKRMLGSIPVPYRKTRNRLNRRLPWRGDLCGRLPDRTVRVVIAIDTSGSMSSRMIADVLSESYNIIKVYQGFEITVIECDSEIGRIYKIRNEADLAAATSKGVTGRGGTSFIPVIEYINGHKKYKSKYPEAGTYKDALLVYFTDGYGDSKIPKPETYRNLWVVFGKESNLSLEEPYGEIKPFKGDKGRNDY